MLNLEIPTGIPRVGVTRAFAGLPGGAVLLERAASLLRVELRANGREDWKLYYEPWHSFECLDDLLPQVDDRAAWQPVSAFTGLGEALDAAYLDESQQKLRPSPAGILWLPRHGVVIARWNWYDQAKNTWRWLTLVAGESLDAIEQLRKQLIELTRKRNAPQWIILDGREWTETRVERDSAGDEAILLSDATRKLAEENLVRFFNPEVAAMYAAVAVPYRRGVLLHGPPGNGKTSLVRWLGARLPSIPMFLVRPGACFDTDSLASAMKKWRQQAPAVLVIEDLNWIIKHVELSTLLNLLDGVEQPKTGGLLLIGTTNYPEQLDPALSDRPGRFDVAIELSCPEPPLRRQYLASRIGIELDDSTWSKLIDATDGLSFAHLGEVLRRSGMAAIEAGRTTRTPEELLTAAGQVRRLHEEAIRGFPRKMEMPFGLQHLHAARKSECRKAEPRIKSVTRMTKPSPIEDANDSDLI